MTTTSLTPPAGEPWPEAGDFPPPLLPPAPVPEGAAPGRTAHPPLFPEFPLPPTGPKGPASWAGRLRTLPARTWRGRPEDPRWVRPSLLALLAASAVLYLWGLSASGWANSFYSAAAQAGSRSWKAFFYGSSDAGNFITVDKPPLALWPMALSARVFGLSSWSVLAPQALMAVGTVATLYATVRRRFSPLAGLLAGLAFAVTPVAALMFRFNNPDALLVLLLTLAAYGMVRAIEAAGTRWLVFTGVMLGLAFLTKTLQAFLVLPAFVLIYLVVAPTGLWRRVRQLLAGGLAMVVAGGWWVAVVELVPASARPYIGGSQDNSFLSLTFGYNGLGRLNGNETGSVGGGGRGRLPAGAEAVFGNGPGGAPAGAPPGGMPGGARGGGGWGETGITRLFDGDIGGQIAWLLPAALILLLLGLWATRRYARTDTARAAFLVWGGWLLCTALTFSFMSGIFHQYYTVALAPAVAALVGMGVDGLWRARHRLPYAAVLAATLAVTAVWAYVLLGRSSDFQPWLRPAVLAGGLLAAVALLVAGPLGARLAAGAPTTGAPATDAGTTGAGTTGAGADTPTDAVTGTPADGRAGARRIAGRVTAVAGLVGAAAALGGPAAYALETVGTPHQGSIVLAGPAVAGGFGPGGMRGRGADGGGPVLWLNGRMVTPQQGGGQGGGQAVPGSPQQDGGRVPNGNGSAQGPGPYIVIGGPGGMNGLLNGAQVSDEAAALVAQDADRYRWAAATSGSQNAASYQLASGVPVMALGGFNSSDPSLSLDAFRQYVQEGKVHWFIGGGSRRTGGIETAGANTVYGVNGPSDESSQSQTAKIEEWVEAHYTARTVGGSTFYDLTRPPTS
ncbi:glycosyltransferase family 39 protein [Kitasatospora purpeofusca]|uniref:Glycosyltransferase family 39 protein n=1 Tax=Kitasatospora purpeofusca TaxID=67352 RepID=A0ABZ1U6E2_9ACTN|nr:glycosyltransferase family 39 protein [Kitasatospora purpeofusca]